MTPLAARARAARSRDLVYAPRRHPVQLAVGILVLVFLILIGISLFNNKNMQWNVVAKYLFDPHILQGILVTLGLTVLCQTLAIIIGVLVAVMRLSASRVMVPIAIGYLWFFRGTPLLVQLVFWYNIAALFPHLVLGIPLTDYYHVISTNKLISGFTAAILGFSLHESAYMAEIVRAGILSVNKGQKEAALSTGMTEASALRRIVLPQAMRVIIPPTGNQAINLLKATSLVAFISGGDLLSNVTDIYSVSFAVIPLLVVASIWYLALVTVATIGQTYLELAFGKGYGSTTSRKRSKSQPDDSIMRSPPPPKTCEHPVEIENLVKRFGDPVVLDDISLTVPSGEVLAIIGPSGSGKSTLLRCINHLEKPSAGTIKVCGDYIGYRRQGNVLREIGGRELARQRSRTGMVFQNFNLYPHKTALENIIESPVHVRGVDAKTAKAQAYALLERVGLSERAGAYPAQLSGGQQQRVAIARALATEPEVMLFDEPTSALDPELVGEVLTVMREIAASGMTMMVVTHEIQFAHDVCSRVVFMADGILVEEGAPGDVLDNPQAERTQLFLGRFNARA